MSDVVIDFLTLIKWACLSLVAIFALLTVAFFSIVGWIEWQSLKTTANDAKAE